MREGESPFVALAAKYIVTMCLYRETLILMLQLAKREFSCSTYTANCSQSSRCRGKARTGQSSWSELLKFSSVGGDKRRENRAKRRRAIAGIDYFPIQCSVDIVASDDDQVDVNVGGGQSMDQ